MGIMMPYTADCGSTFQIQPLPSSLHHALSDFTLPILCPLKSVGVRAVVHHGLVNLFLAVDDKGAVLHDLLVQRQAGNEDETSVLGGVGGDGHDDAVALLLEDDVVVLADGRRLLLDDVVGQLLSRVDAAVQEARGAGQGVGESVEALGKGLDEAAAGLDGHVEKPDGRVGELLDAVDAVALAGDDLDVDLGVIDVDKWDLGGA